MVKLDTAMRRTIAGRARLLAVVLAAVVAGPTAARTRMLPWWPDPAPTARNYRLQLGADPVCREVLQYVRGEPRSGVQPAAWAWPEDLGEQLGPDYRASYDARVARVAEPPISGLVANRRETKVGSLAANFLELPSEDRQNFAPIADGVIDQSANLRNIDVWTSTASNVIAICQSCSSGRLHIATTLVTFQGHVFQLYATWPAKYVGVWTVSLGSVDDPRAHQLLCFIRR
jgi:hypothetical protein